MYIDRIQSRYFCCPNPLTITMQTGFLYSNSTFIRAG